MPVIDSSSRATKSQIIFILSIGVFAISTAAIIIRLATEAAGLRGSGFSLFLAASRLTIASFIMLPAWRSLYQNLTAKSLFYSTLAGVFLGLHYATWITSLSYTSIAASTTLVTTNPVWVTLISWFWFKEKPSISTIIGISIAMVGGVLIGLDGITMNAKGSHVLWGNFLALVGSWAISIYFLLGREAQRQGLGTSLYAAIAYSAAALTLLPLPQFFATPYLGYPLSVYAYTILLALLPQLIGQTSLNWAVTQISPTVVTLVITLEPIVASFLGYLLFGEFPNSYAIVGSLILLIGVSTAAVGSQL
ncbi:MAG: EamA family transporter [Chroococcidiopsidaceae cyanobacterium CP_BM_ER_R8_30]|nr:EamA family transporter [Chroococcidiopsidaceae cyanobacterium CP_BM_ER_R8_30]